MLEWLQSGDFKGPADTAATAPRSSLRLNHVEMVSRMLDDPSFDPDGAGVPQGVRDIARNRARLAKDRARLAEDRARERVELRFGSFAYTMNAQGLVRIVAYDGHDPSVEVPGSIKGGEVVALASGLFSGHEEIESVAMPDSVEAIGHRAFEKCSGLKRVRLSAELKQVGSGVFAQCGRIDEVEINSPIVSIEGKLLSGVSVARISFGSRVRDVDLVGCSVKDLESVSVDGANPFLSTDGISLFSRDGKTLVCMVVPRARCEIPAGCEVVGEKAFDSVRALSSVSLPEGLRTIECMAFAKTSLREVAFPDSLESVGDKAFFSCTQLRAADLPRSLRFLGAEAFASSGVERVALPSSLERLGARVFDKTPAQKNVSNGSVTVRQIPSTTPAAGGLRERAEALTAGAAGELSEQAEAPAVAATGELRERVVVPATPTAGGLRIDRSGGVYQGSTFLELFGLVESYGVAPGTTRIAAGACKRHETLCAVTIPEGVVEIGDDAFRGARSLRAVDLPETLQTIGARAFLDTSVSLLRLGPAVRRIGECALVAQGENPFLGSGRALQLDLDGANGRFYIESGLLCERGAGKAGGDAVVAYTGPENVVRVPRAATQINAYAFCGLDGVSELYLHDRVLSICTGALSTKQAVRVLHLEFPEEVEGVRAVRLPMPSYTSRYRSMMPLFEAADRQTRFNFEYYDTWVANSLNTAEFAPAALARLRTPVRLCERCRSLYEGLFVRKAAAVCRYFAGRGDLDALEQLYEWGYLTCDQVEAELASSLELGEAQATACLLELRRRISRGSGSVSSGLDLSL